MLWTLKMVPQCGHFTLTVSTFAHPDKPITNKIKIKRMNIDFFI
jgi:hypothetical protein